MFTAYQVKLLSLVSVIQGWPYNDVILEIMKTHGILFDFFPLGDSWSYSESL